MISISQNHEDFKHFAPNHAKGVYIINSAGIAYHQCEALYIIKPQEDARWRVMRYSPKGADDIHDCVVMICQACGLDKKFDKSKLVEFFGRGRRTRTHDTQFWRLVFYRLNYTPIFVPDYYTTYFFFFQDLFEKKLIYFFFAFIHP